MKHLLLFLILMTTAFAEVAVQGKEFKTKLTKFSYGESERSVPLKIYLPKEKKAPVILMSHGLTGSRESCTYLGNYWASRGFVVVAMQHAGSDVEILRGIPPKQYYKRALKAASFSSFLARNNDVKATLDTLTLWNKNEKHFLHGRCDMNKVGIAGHSFGAITSQAVTGQNFPIIGQTFTDKRIKVACCLSPSPAFLGSNADAFSEISVPWLLMTGTKDIVSVTPKITVASRKSIYKLLPKKTKAYLLVLNNATHMAFHDTTLRNKPHANKKHHKAIKRISYAFFSAHLKLNDNARNWIQSKKVRSLLDHRDSWQWK